MKGYRKNGGWLYRCDGGPLGGHHIRGYNQIRRDGQWEDANPDWEFRVQGHQDEGRYILTPLLKANGERRMAKHKGVEHPAFHYVWEKNPSPAKSTGPSTPQSCSKR